MKQQSRGKRFYKVGEEVYIKSEKTLGVITDLNIKPEDGLYQALVKYKQDNEIVHTNLNLWEIDKNKVEFYKQKRKGAVPKKKHSTKNIPTVLFAKVRETATIPSKVEENAGYDIYANFEEDYILINPNEVKMIPTGVASSVKDDWSLIVKERGSTGTKAMAVRAGVVDSGYRGEIFIAINNTGKKPILIVKENVLAPIPEGVTAYPYKKAIAQLLLVPVPKANVKEISYEELKAIPSSRGTGSVGSSGK